MSSRKLKFYEAGWQDHDHGVTRVFDTNKRKALKARRERMELADRPHAYELSEHVVPYTRAGIMQFLNVYCGTDN